MAIASTVILFVVVIGLFIAVGLLGWVLIIGGAMSDRDYEEAVKRDSLRKYYEAKERCER